METNEENEYKNKLKSLANSLSDKMAILEARDRLMRLKRSRQTDLATAVAVVGTCPDMCPEFERYFREETNQISNFEVDSNGRPDEHRMIKEYRRSGADQEEPLAHELRPAPVLNTTMDYLCTNIMDYGFDLNTGSGCGDWYDFVWSRTRSIRKDITQQHMCDDQSVALTEKCARFHIHCSATFCEQDLKDFDPKINEENLSNCLQSLKDFYYDLSLRDIYCPNEAEFRCYEILLHLNDTKILRDVQNYRPLIRESPQVQFALKAFFAFQSNNYILFFKLLDKCSYLMACVLHRYFTSVRQKAFKILRKSYTSNASSVQEYPAQALIDGLGFDTSDEFRQFCDHLGLEFSEGVVYLIRGQNQNNAIKAKRSHRLVDSKLSTSVGEVINGQPLPPNPYRAKRVHNSFDSDGRLKTSAIEALDQQIKNNNTSDNTSDNDNYESSYKPVFGTTPEVKTSFPAIQTGAKSLFSNAIQTLFKPQTTSTATNLTDKYITEPKTNKFSFNTNSSFNFRLGSHTSTPTIQTSNQNTNNMFNTIKVMPNIMSNRIDLNQIQSTPERQTPDEFNSFGSIEKLLDSILDEMIESVLNELLVDICSEELSESLSFETMCSIFSEILLNTTDNMIKELAVNVIREEIDLKIEKTKRIEIVSIDLCNEITNNFVDSEISDLSEEILNRSRDEYIEKQNEMIANEFFDEQLDDSVQEIATIVHKTASKDRESMVQSIRERKLKRLTEKCFQKWKNWYLKRKRLKYLKESFPAAPNWKSSPTSSPTNQLNYSFNRQSFEDNCDKTVERQLMAKCLLNNSIDLVIKDIATEVLDILVTGRDRIVDYIKAKRLKRLENKYFQKWKTYCFEKRHKDMLRKTFPAAPDWRSTNGIASRIKYSFSCLDSDLKISPKRMRREVNEEISSGEEALTENDLTNSALNLRQLLDNEMFESKSLTKRLTESLKEMNSDECVGQTVLESNIISTDAEEEEEMEEDLETIEVFESQTDKMNRLKRLLSEEKDYFSLQNFVQYLSNNSTGSESCIEDSTEVFE